jgi:hypothetical protein
MGVDQGILFPYISGKKEYCMEITIQRDGRIAIKEHGEDIRFADVDDPIAIVAIFRAHTVFEDGLTLRQLMKALRPWQDVLSRTAWMNFDAWVTAADKTHVAGVNEDDAEEPVVAVEIYCVLDIWRTDDNVVQISSHWDFNGKFAKPVDLGSGHLSDSCGLSFSAPKTFANVPIVINNKPTVHDIAVGPPDGKRPIISEQEPDVYESLELFPTFFDTVVLGLLDKLSFHGDPEDTEDRGNEIAEMVASIKDRPSRPIVDEADNGEGDETAEVDEDDESLTMSFEEFSTSLGITRDRLRDDAAFNIHKALRGMPAADEQLADLLGLTTLGLHELKRGITAHFSTETLVKMVTLIAAWEQNKQVQEPALTSNGSPTSNEQEDQP